MSENPENWQLKASEWFCLAGMFSFTWRAGLIFNIKICDFLFLTAALFLFWSLLRARENGGTWNEARAFVRPALLTMIGIMLGSVIGSLWSATISPAWATYLGKTVEEYGRMIFCFALFWFILYLCLRNKNFARRAMAVMIVSPLLLWISFLPSLHGRFFSGDERLTGPGGDPNYLGSWIAVSFVVAVAVFLFRSDRKARFTALAAVFTLPLLFWTGSRAAVVSLVVGLIAVVAYYLVRGPAGKKIWKMLLLTVVIAGGVTIAFSAASPVMHKTMVYRLVNSYSNFKMFKLGSISGDDLVMSLSDTGGMDRAELATRALYLSSHAPFGYGPAYYFWQPVALSFSGDPLPAHDIFLEAALRAGWLGFFCLIYLLWLIGRRFAIAARKINWWYAAAGSAFSVMLITSLAADTMTLRWFWVIAALAASAIPTVD